MKSEHSGLFHQLRFAMIGVLLLFSESALSESKPPADIIRLASTSWCPYICDEPNEPGFIVEYMTELLSRSGTELQVDVFPWSRSIILARQGDYDGLLTAVQSEAPDFTLTNAPSGSYQNCLYKKVGSEITYKDRSSFQNLVLGGVKDYGYGEPINSLISNPRKGEKAYLISHDNPLDLLIKMTDKQRIDLFVSDSAVLKHFIKLNPTQNLVEVAGCTEETPFYTAISPNNPLKDYWLSTLNKLLSSAESKKLYDETKSRYEE